MIEENNLALNSINRKESLNGFQNTDAVITEQQESTTGLITVLRSKNYMQI